MADMTDRDQLFGFEIIKKQSKKTGEVKSFVPPEDPDGTAVVSAGGHFGEYLDQDASSAKNDSMLILKYRDAAAQPEVDAAIEDIVNEAIVIALEVLQRPYAPGILCQRKVPSLSDLPPYKNRPLLDGFWPDGNRIQALLVEFLLLY